MEDIPYLERILIFVRNSLKDFINFVYFLFWVFIDPRKFVKIDRKKIKNILVISGGAIGDIYNVAGVINAVVSKYSVNVFLLTYEKNRKFIMNPKIKVVTLKEANDLTDKRKFDAAVLIDPGRDRRILDKSLFIKLLKIPYVVCSDSLKLDPRKIKIQYFPILASRKVYPIRANGPRTFLNLFSLLNLEVPLPEFYFTKRGEKFAKNFFRMNMKRNEEAVIVHPGAGKIVKALEEGKCPAHLWPEERWARLIDRILTKKNLKVIITGLESESKITGKIYDLVKNKERVVYSVAKIPDIESLASVVKMAKATVTPDTSMAHISSHVKTPAIILYSSDSPKRIGPVGLKNINIYHENKAHDCRKYACEYCYEVHMKSISVNEVYSSLIELLR